MTQVTASACTPWCLCVLPDTPVQAPSLWHPLAAAFCHCVCQAVIDSLPLDCCLGQLVPLQPFCTGSSATCPYCKHALVMLLLQSCASVDVQRHTCYADLFVLHCVAHASSITACHSCSPTKLLLLQAVCTGEGFATSLLSARCQWCLFTMYLCCQASSHPPLAASICPMQGLINLMCIVFAH